MKEKANVQSAAPRKVKGTVLFTVVCVMMVLIVFLMGTLALATTANNRAMKNFSTAQTQQTAKAGVEAVMAAMRNDKDVAQAVANITATTPITNIAIDLESTSMGRIQDVKVELAGTKYIVDTHDDSATKNQMVPKKVIRISATAVQGSASSTVTAYVLSDPDSGNSDTVTVSPSANGFVSTGGAGTSNHVSAYGGTAFGFDESYNVGYYVPSNQGFALSNGETNETDIRINGNLTIAATDIVFLMKGVGSGATIWGSLEGANNLQIKTVNSQVKSDAGYLNAGMSYKDIPFLYVDRTLDFSNSGVMFDIKDDTALNVYCGEFLLGRKSESPLNCNVYCFNENDGTTVTENFKNRDGASYTKTYQKGVSKITGDDVNLLYGWSNSVLNAEGNTQNIVSGNFYSNGDLILDSNGSKYGTVGRGNVVKIQGNLTVSRGNHTINGDLYVGGTLAVTGGSLKVTGDLHYDGSAPSGVTVDGNMVPLSSYNAADVVRKLKTGYTQDPAPKTAVYAKDLNTGSGNFKAWMKQEWNNNRDAATVNANIVEKITDDQLNLKNENGKWVYEGGDKNGQEYDGVIPTYINYYDSAHNIVTQDEATELWYRDDLADTTKAGKKVVAESVYPKEYTREVLTGMAQYNAATPIEKTKVVTFPYELLADPTKTPYSTYTDVKDSSRTDEDSNPISDKKLCEDNLFKLGGGITTVKGNADGKIAYDAGTKTYTIGDSCSICGGLDGETLVLSPPNNTAIWVVIVPNGGTNQFVMDSEGGIQGKIILDDEHTSGTANILLKTNLDISSQGHVITTSKYETLLNNGTPFQIYTDTKYAMSGVEVAPNININIYSDTEGRSISLSQNHTLIANINAPYCDFSSANNGLTPSSNTIYYNRYNIMTAHTQHRQVAVIGQCIVKNFSSGNEWTLLYKPTTGGTVPPPGEDNFEDALMTSWSVLYWENY